MKNSKQTNINFWAQSALMRSDDLGLNLNQLSTEHVLDWEVHYNYFFLITQSVFDTTHLWVSNDVRMRMRMRKREVGKKRKFILDSRFEITNKRKKEKERE